MNSVPPSNVTPEEFSLVAQAAAGDREARRALFERYREAAFRTALRIVRREADAFDIVQDAFIRAFERLADFQQDASFQTWLMRIVSNRSLDVLRSRKVRLAASLDGDEDGGGVAAGLAADEEPPEAGLERRELGERLASAIASLPTEQRVVFALFATGELTYAQIAEVVGIPIGTVMSRIFHARKKLGQMLPDLAAAFAQARPRE